jgi:hypothetical protein
MQIPHWQNPGRKRNTNIAYTGQDYTKYYDLDLKDFTDLVIKLRNNKVLSYDERERYGVYIITISLMVQEGPKFKCKSKQEREEMLDYQTLELLSGLTQFDPDRGSSIYSYAYRIGYTAACHYYTDKIQDYKKKQEILKHCLEELEEYNYEYSTHKVSNLNKE